MMSKEPLHGHQDLNILEKAALMLPGVSGYLEKEMARDSDRRLRAYLADRLTAVKDSVHVFQRKRTDEGRLSGLDKLERINRKLDRLRDTVRYSAGGYSGLFDGIKVDKEKLRRLYSFDLELKGHIDALDETFVKLMNETGKTADIDTVAGEMEKHADDFQTVLDRRKHLLEEGH